MLIILHRATLDLKMGGILLILNETGDNSGDQEPSDDEECCAPRYGTYILSNLQYCLFWCFLLFAFYLYLRKNEGAQNLKDSP